MARPIWRGSISFGLVNVPVSLYPAEKPNELRFSMIDNRNGAGIRYRKVNAVTGEEVPGEQIVKGYELESGKIVILSDEDFKQAAPAKTQLIEILNFVPESDVSPVYFIRPYYLLPSKRSEKGFLLLTRALRESGKIGVARLVIHTREYMAALIPTADDGLILNLLRFDDELRTATDVGFDPSMFDQVSITDKEVALANQLIESMSSPWDPKAYKDSYRGALMRFIEQKAEGAVVKPEEVELPKEGGVIDLVELLRKSVREREERAAPSGQKRTRKQA